MRKNFELTFKTDKDTFSLNVSIVKSFGERISLKTGYDGQPVRWVKATLKDPSLKKVTCRKELDKIVQQDELEYLYPSGEEDDEGNPIFVKIDKNSLKDSFPSTSEMNVVKTIKSSLIPFYYLDDAHYFLNVKTTKKVAKEDDKELYSLIFSGLKDRKEALLVRYHSMNTIKHGIVYTSSSGLMLSNIIPTNYQRERDDEQKLKTKRDLKFYDRLVESTRSDEIGKFEDKYGKLLEKLIQATIRGDKIEKKNFTPKLLSKLSNLFSDD